MSFLYPVGNSQMSFRGTGQGKEQLGTLSPGDVHRERVNEFPGFTFFLSPGKEVLTIARPRCWTFVSGGLGTEERC